MKCILTAYNRMALINKIFQELYMKSGPCAVFSKGRGYVLNISFNLECIKISIHNTMDYYGLTVIN